eukprot:SAG31_NODE_31344_length_369_cov_0.885185_1_plen_71_part_10
MVMHMFERLCIDSVLKTLQKRIDQWRAQKVLYTTPRGMNDDWFWLYAGVVGTRGSGHHTIVVSNDQMRSAS